MSNSNGNSNGNSSVSAQAPHDLSNLEMVVETKQPDTAEKPKAKKKTNKTGDDLNNLTTFDLILDAGSLFIKGCLNGEVIPPVSTVYKIVKGTLPSGKAGVFEYKGKNYSVGTGAHSEIGELVEGHDNNKIKKLDIWLLGAITSDPDFLDELIADKKKCKYSGKPYRLNCNLKLLSLSDNKSTDIVKVLQDTKEFTYRGRVFEIKFANIDGEFVYTEGYGAALTAIREIDSGLKEFMVFDLGGGTVCNTLYRLGRGNPKVYERKVSSGSGMYSVASRVFISLSKSDKGGKEKSLNSLFSALRNASPTSPAPEIKNPKKVDEYRVPYRIGSNTFNISEEVFDGLKTWVTQSPSVTEILSQVSEYLLGGGYVFATGGGFASQIIADWITDYVCNDISNAQFLVLENPQVVNLTGMQLLDKQNTVK